MTYSGGVIVGRPESCNATQEGWRDLTAVQPDLAALINDVGVRSGVYAQ
jgi:hypothetical protein